MSQPEELDDLQKKEKEIDQVSDTYMSETASDIYNTPDISGGQIQESGSYDNDPYGNGTGQNTDPYRNDPYGNGTGQNTGSYRNDPYGNGTGQNADPYRNDPYGNRTGQNADPYRNDPYGNGTGQNADPYRNNPYGNGTGWNGGSYHNGPHDNNPYGNGPEQNDGPYHNGAYESQYSPYAVPDKKNNNRLIIGIVAGVIILFLVAVFAFTYKIISLYSERIVKSHHSFEEYAFGDDRESNREKRREENDIESYDYDDSHGYDDFYDYDDYYGYDDFYGYDDYYDDDYDPDNDQYYTLHDDIQTDLSYSIDFDYYEYDTDNENVAIVVSYPIIEGDNVPNLEHLNDVIEDEIDLFKEYFEEEYAGYMDEEDGYFSAISSGYVTYMDEEKLSIVFSEYIYTDYYNEAFLYCINIDMENGVILDNENMLNIDDDFSVEFRKRSDIQNGEIVYLTGMTDQEITDYFNSSGVIVFYTPKGMEIGFNYEEGWVTVTYEEYEEYLKVF